jgi:glycosyltransferase involved in cell wall biosynthesis
MQAFSVVINTYNRAKSLRQTLEGLAQLDYPLFEIVAVNGPSTDGTAGVLAKFDGRIKVARLAERNLAKSRNIGVAAAAGDIVAFIDDDAYPDSSWLSRLAEGYDREEIAGVGGPTYDHTGYLLQSHSILSDRLGESLTREPGLFDPTLVLSRPYTWLYPRLLGTNSSFRRSHLVEIGGFDEEFDYYLDETDVCLRLIDHGYMIRSLDDGYVYHKFLASHLRTETRVLRDRFSVIKNKVYFAFKHASSTASFSDLSRDLTAFVRRHRRECRSEVRRGRLNERDLHNFERDVRSAFEVGIARARDGIEMTRPAAWFAENQMPFAHFQQSRSRARNLHLCFLSSEYPPAFVNGIGRFTHEMAVGLVERGHHIHVLTRGEGHHRVDLEDGVWVHRIVPVRQPRPRTPSVPQDVWNYSASLYDEVLRIHRHRPLDLVEAPLWDSEGIAAVLGEVVPVVVSLHTPLPIVLRSSPHWTARRKTRKSRIEPLVALERFCLERCAAVLANSASIIDDIKTAHGLTLDPSRCRIVPHGFAAKPNGLVTPRDSVAPHILFVGRLERRKGIDLLLESIRPLSHRLPGIRFTIVGDDTLPTAEGPPYREQFERRSSARNVEFKGRVDDENLEQFYRSCDVLVAPSRYESFGLILIEAMRYGKPVVACDVGGMREIVVDGENGFLVPPGDSPALIEAIATLASRADMRHSMGQRSLQIYEQRFTRRVMAEAAEKFYLEVAAGTYRAVSGSPPGGSHPARASGFGSPTTGGQGLSR